MKNILFILIAALLTACSDFTQVPTPSSQLTTPSVFQSLSTAEAATADIYARFREDAPFTGSLNGYAYLLENAIDNMDCYATNAEMQQFANNAVQPSNSLVAGLWNGSYGIIYQCNAVLEGLENADAIPPADRDRLRGEALFMRAFVHFHLANAFGSVPYVTTTDYAANSSIGKITAGEARERALTDALEAEALLPSAQGGVEHYRVDRGVARAFLARIYLYMENWSAAAQKATEVIDDPAYVWVSDPTLEFLRSSTDAIWSLESGIEGVNTKEARTFNFGSNPTRSALTAEFADSFEPGDLRRSIWVRTVNASSGTYYASRKYQKSLSTFPAVEYTIVLRLAEQYLIRAEARAMESDVAGAKADIDKIRERAGLPGTAAAGPAALLAAIEAERRHEFFCEFAHRWFDLRRTGRMQPVMAALDPSWNPRNLLFPLPEKELSLNPSLLPQNTGY